MLQNPDQLSQLILEADALMLLLHYHREDTPADAIVLLRKKLQLILSLIDGIEEEPAPQQESDPSQQQVADYIEDTVEDAGAYEDGSNINPDHYAYMPHETYETPDAQPAPEEYQDDYYNEENTDYEYEESPQAEDNFSEETYAPAHPSTQGASRRPVSTVFNLNDKFRFRRELFGNSEVAYVECLNMLTAMNSLEEAEDYLYQDLQWDPQNEDVKSFVELLANYYK